MLLARTGGSSSSPLGNGNRLMASAFLYLAVDNLVLISRLGQGPALNLIWGLWWHNLLLVEWAHQWLCSVHSKNLLPMIYNCEVASLQIHKLVPLSQSDYYLVCAGDRVVMQKPLASHFHLEGNATTHRHQSHLSKHHKTKLVPGWGQMKQNLWWGNQLLCLSITMVETYAAICSMGHIHE